jgi:hypothetical protein
VSELAGRGAAWTEERGTSAEGRQRRQAARQLAGRHNQSSSAATTSCRALLCSSTWAAVVAGDISAML